MSEFLVEAARHNPAIAHNLKKLRQRAEAAIRDAAVADTVLDARDLRAGDDVVHSRHHSPSSAAFPAAIPGGTAIDLTKSWSTSLLHGVAAPDVFAVKPLAELELLALRSAQQLRRRHARLRPALRNHRARRPATGPGRLAAAAAAWGRRRRKCWGWKSGCCPPCRRSLWPW